MNTNTVLLFHLFHSGWSNLFSTNTFATLFTLVIGGLACVNITAVLPFGCNLQFPQHLPHPIATTQSVTLVV